MYRRTCAARKLEGINLQTRRALTQILGIVDVAMTVTAGHVEEAMIAGMTAVGEEDMIAEMIAEAGIGAGTEADRFGRVIAETIVVPTAEMIGEMTVAETTVQALRSLQLQNHQGEEVTPAGKILMLL